MDTLNGDIQILQLSEDCYWTIVVFSLAHEIAHYFEASDPHPQESWRDPPVVGKLFARISEDSGVGAALGAGADG